MENAIRRKSAPDIRRNVKMILARHKLEPSRSNMMDRPFIGIDFGGTNLRIAKVNPKTGEVEGDVITHVSKRITSNQKLTERIMEDISGRFGACCNIGISAAGDVDEKGLVIRISPNASIKEQITFGRSLEEMGHNVVMTNDMKAASQAAARYGEGRGLENVLLATYSSGYNSAKVSGGRNMTTAEIGHIPYGKDLFCGCGKKGHLEIYVSANGAASMAMQFFLTTLIRNHPILMHALKDFNDKAGERSAQQYDLSDLKEAHMFHAIIDSIGAKHVYQAFREDPESEPQRSIRNTQVKAISDSFAIMNSAFNPLDIMVLMGSQTKDWDVLFEPSIGRFSQGNLQLQSLHIPRIVRTSLPEIGVQGAVAYLIAQMGSQQ